MKNYALLLLSAVALLFTGCASNPNQQAAVDLAIGVASDAATIVVRRNPEARAVLSTLSLAIDGALTAGALTQGDVEAFVARIDKNNHLTADDRFLIGSAIRRVHQALVVYGGAPDLNIGDPKIKAALVRVQTALTEILGA